MRALHDIGDAAVHGLKFDGTSFLRAGAKRPGDLIYVNRGTP